MNQNETCLDDKGLDTVSKTDLFGNCFLWKVGHCMFFKVTDSLN